MIQKIWEFITLGPVKIFASVVVALLGIYGTFGYERKPEVTFEVISNASVLDVKETLNQLVISYAGTNLKEQNQSLHLITVRVSNSGNADIVKASFDDSYPLGFRVSAGTILETPTIVADEYLKTNLKPTVRNGNTIVFSPVILNSDDSFDAKTLLLVKNGESPKISALGKIAGIRDIHLSEPFRESNNKNYVEDAFQGNMLVQLGRLGAYSLATVILLITLVVVIFVPAEYISGRWQKYGRKTRIGDYRKALGRKMSLQEEFLATNYVENSNVFKVFKHLASPKTKSSHTNDRFYLDKEMWITQRDDFALEASDIEESYKELENAGIILRDGPQISISADVEAQAKAFLSFIAKAK